MSNELGRRFGQRAADWDTTHGDYFDVAGQWESFLKGAGAIKYATGTYARVEGEIGRTLEQWTKDDTDAYWLMRLRGDSRAWVHSLEQAEAFKKSQDMWKCLCDGDRPRLRELTY